VVNFHNLNCFVAFYMPGRHFCQSLSKFGDLNLKKQLITEDACEGQRSPAVPNSASFRGIFRTHRSKNQGQAAKAARTIQKPRKSCGAFVWRKDKTQNSSITFSALVSAGCV
jgi:hypothetical protein